MEVNPIKTQRTTFTCNSKIYDVHIDLYTEYIAMQFLFKSNPEGNSTFTLDFLCSLSKYFRLFDTLESLYNDLIGKSYTITCDETRFNIEYFINELSFTTVNFPIPILVYDNQKLNEDIQTLTAKLIKLEASIMGKEASPMKSLESCSFVPFVTDRELELPLKHIRKYILRLLYNPSRETDKLDIYHDCCDTIFPLIVFIETNCGTRFGGYTSVGWDPIPIQSVSGKKVTCKL